MDRGSGMAPMAGADRLIAPDSGAEPAGCWSGLGSCPYWQHARRGEPFGTCSFGCYDEPRCLTDEPRHGWTYRNRYTGRFMRKEGE